MEKPIRSLVLSVFGTLVFPIGSIVILTLLWGLNGVWLSPTVSGFLTSIVALTMLKTLKWNTAMPMEKEI